jgi:hypothetical protein
MKMGFDFLTFVSSSGKYFTSSLKIGILNTITKTNTRKKKRTLREEKRNRIKKNKREKASNKNVKDLGKNRT